MDIIFLLVLIVFNGVLVMAEMALVASRKVRLQQMAERGDRGARTALHLVSNPNRFLSTVQIGITLIAILTGAVAEVALVGSVAESLNQIQWIEPHGRGVALSLVVVGVTFVSLVIGELVPKRLALNAPERLARIVARPMQVFSFVIAPVVKTLNLITEFLLKPFPGKVVDDKHAAAQDIRSLIQQGTVSGLFHEKERELVDRVFRLADQRVAALMVPRTDIAWLSADATPERVRIAVATSSYSHFPVVERDLDQLIGVVHLKDMIKSGLLTQSINLRILARKPLFVPESMPALRLVEEFRRSKQHVAFVLDEYGVIAGLITLNDIVEGLLGQMTRLGEDTEPLALRRPDGTWLLDGSLPVEDLRAIMNVDRLPHQDRTTFQTVAGFVMTFLGRVPRTGEVFKFDTFQFEVVDMDRHRIDKVLLSFVTKKT